MFNKELDSTLEKTLLSIMKLYDGKGGQVSVIDVDPIILNELKRRGYIDYLDFDLSSGAVLIPSYKALAYKADEGSFLIPMSKKTRIFDTFTESYTRIKSIGNGGAGTVFEVESSDGTRYALKLLSTEAARSTSKLKRFIQEAQFERDCKCEFIVNAIDFGCLYSGDNKQPFYVMPLMYGSLANLISRRVEFSSTTLLKMFIDLLSGLRQFYSGGNYHRDIKPQNILYDDTLKRLVLSDLGIAHIETHYPGATVETVASDRLANFQYAAPEQRVKGGKCDQRADIYAYGLILNELFTGTAPQGTSYKRIRDIAPEYAYLDKVVERMIAQNPSDRYANIDSMLLDVEVLSKAADAELASKQSEESIVDSSDVLEMRIINKKWYDGAIFFEMNDDLHGQWLTIFKSYEHTSFCTDGFHLDPNWFEITGRIIKVFNVGYNKERAKDTVEYVSNAVTWANNEYVRMVNNERKRAHEEEVKRRKVELDRADKNAKFSREINDMLAQL